ncbi:MAG: cytochrome c oxidase assembly protein [Actinomycetota bacterium]|nr:cytochrome c oxidase assembly protein [Actinomycetota bacterium]
MAPGEVSPFSFHVHPVVTTAALAAAALYPLLLAGAWGHRSRRLSGSAGRQHYPVRQALSHLRRSQAALFYVGLLSAYLAMAWPLGDIARHYSVLAYLGSNSLLVLGSTPLMLAGLPRWFFAEITRRRLIDTTLKALTRPIAATLVFSAAVVTSMLPAVVEAESRSDAAWAAFHLALVGAAAVMWVTALSLLPGLHRLSTYGRVGFLFVQSLLPTFPGIALIFAKHSFYAPYRAGAAALGLNPLTDQQLAGAAIKGLSILVFWTVAAIILAKASKDEEQGRDPESLTWDDVEREFERHGRPAAAERDG